jgi:hypothetical protein
MVKCNQSFYKYLKEITIKQDKIDTLMKKKSTIREKIRKSFEEKNRATPKFWIQGSMDTDTSTGIIPADSTKGYDIDDGVYLDPKDVVNEKGEFVTPATVHRWVYEAVSKHTNDVSDKQKCVRVKYANELQVDLPIYVQKGDEYYLAIKNGDWIESNPKEISNWFNEQIRNSKEDKDRETYDFRKVIKLLKAWKDNKESKRCKIIGGFQLSVLTANNMPEKYDDIEELFYKVVTNIANNIDNLKDLKNPINDNSIVDHYSDVVIENNIKLIKDLCQIVTKAYNAEDHTTSKEEWTKVWGDRFDKCYCDIDEEKEMVINTVKTTGVSGGYA